jgi:hypothetical protein
MIAKPSSLICVVLLLTGEPLFSQASQPQWVAAPGYVQQAPAPLVIPDGTPVRLSLEEALNSANCEVGEAIYFRVVDDVRVGNVVAIPGGLTATGHITNDEHKKMLGRGGKIEFAVDYVKPSSGTQLKVRATSQKQGKDSTGKVITFTILVSPLFLMLHGKEAQIPRGTTITAYIDGRQEVPLTLAAASGPVIVPTSSLQGPVGVDPSAMPRPAPDQSPSKLTIASEPAGAELFVDGDFVGSAPSTIKLASGHHTIKASKPGFRDWERNLTVNPGGEVTVNTVLEKATD